MNLKREIDTYLKNAGIDKLNQMQEKAIQSIETNKDLVLLSPTGSGKTLAFLLPLLQQLERSLNQVQALILTPSRELTLQIEQVFRQLKTAFKINSCYGGHAIATELNNLKHPPAVLVGTPGRVADHLRRQSFQTGIIKYLILDEFDKSLELGFQSDVEFILDHLENIQQRILISATSMDDIPAFAGLQNPQTLDFLAKKDLQPPLETRLVRSEGADKLDAFIRLVCSLGTTPTLVFVNHREAAERMSQHLKDLGIHHGVFHGGMKQEDRERSLLKFRNGSHCLLITTDLAARGLDIPDIQFVIHYQLPLKETAFIHRNGRTARIQSNGLVYLLLAEEEAIPDYIHEELNEEQVFRELNLPPKPDWETIYIAGGKKDKINKVDVVGYFLQNGQLNKNDLGLIHVMDHSAYVAVKRSEVQQLMMRLNKVPIKGKRLKMAISK
jgi:ATP-independent RNA helicase DbpA